MPGGDWSTQQLVEFLAVVSSTADENAAIRAAVERAAEAMEAEMGALVRDGAISAAIGVPEDEGLEEAIVELAYDGAGEVEVEGLGTCWGVAVPLEWPPSSRLVVARFAEPFHPRELNVLRGMTRVLTLTVGFLRRAHLLERVSEIQRLISTRKPLQEVLDAITTGACDLTAADIAGLRLVDPDDPG